MSIPKLVLFGTGTTAERFVKNTTLSHELISVLDNRYDGTKFGHSVTKPEVLKTDRNFPAYDYVMMAVGERPVDVFTLVYEQLLSVGVPQEKILWYNQDRNEITLAHKIIDSRAVSVPTHDNVLYAVYDLRYLPETFDVFNFLCVAEMHRRDYGFSCVKVVVLPPAIQSEREEQYLTDYERQWRLRNITQLAPCFLPSCRGVDICADRREWARYPTTPTNVFPLGFSVSGDTKTLGDNCTSYRHLIEDRAKGNDPRCLEVPAVAHQYAQQWIQLNVPQGKKLITISLRESPLQPLRNSNIAAWNQFAQAISGDAFHVVVLRDAERVFDAPLDGFEGVPFFNEACFNLMLRMGLYANAFLNLGTSNGPTHAMVYFKEMRYLIFKHIVEDYHGSSTAAHVARSIEVGTPFPLCGPGQAFIWTDDRFEDIALAFDGMVSSLSL